MKKLAYCLHSLVAMAALVLPIVAAAQEGRRAPEDHEGERSGMRRAPEQRFERGAHERRIEPWHGDIRRFRQQDFPAWRAGHWFHGPHAGRDGWWWIVGLNWYWYPAPIYPYPDPYLPPAAAAISPPEAAAPQYWYYCANPPGYYPYVPQCYGNWERVPVTPP